MTAVLSAPTTYRETLDRALVNQPRCCPWLGHRAICPAFEPDRDTFWCASCRREWTLRP